MQKSVSESQGERILNNMKALLALLGQESVHKILELDTSVESRGNYDLLNRLSRSLDQYIKRDRNLIYIGFLGHYSAGKSSTINSLLSLGNSENERPVGANPTDTEITLITSPQNNNQVIKLMRHGKVPVVTKTIDNNDFLNDKVIIDTPGSGDPSLYEELVRDSLPLCDLIIYCVSAANPLDSSDIPLLTEKQRNLHQIPTVFVITRANEFRIDRHRPTSQDNIDQEKLITTLSELSSRIKAIVPSIDLGIEDYIIIDNLDSYNTGHLLENIVALTDPSDQQNLIRLHDHKISFFERAFNTIKKYFVGSINDKLITIHNFFEKAQSNVNNYDEKTVLGIDELIYDWKNIDAKIKQVLDGAIDYNNHVHKTIESPSKILDIENVQSWHLSISYRLEQVNEKLAQEYGDDCLTILISLKDQLTQHCLNLIESKDFIDINSVHDFIDHYIQALSYKKYPLEIAFETEYNRFFKEAFNYLSTDRYKQLSGQYKSVQDRIGKRNPLESIFGLITEAKTTLTKIFQSYKEAVRIYRVAAFSSEAKSYIKKLGLSTELDLLDAQDLEIANYLEHTDREVFKNYYRQLEDFRAGCESLEQKLKEISMDQPIMVSHENEKRIAELQFQTQQFIDEALENKTNEVLQKVRSFFIELVETINSELVGASIIRDTKLRAVKRQRFLFYFKWLTPSIGFLLITLAIFLLPRYNITSLNLGGEYLMGILSNVAFATLNTLIAKRKDRFSSKKIELKVEFKQKQKEIINSNLSSQYLPFQKDTIANLKIQAKNLLESKTKLSLSVLISKDLNNVIYDLHAQILSNESRLQSAIVGYSKIITDLKAVTTTILNDTKANKKTLSLQANSIKDNSINPSFNLLMNTKNEITDLKNTLENIRLKD